MYLNEKQEIRFLDGDLNDIEFNFHGSFIDPINDNLKIDTALRNRVPETRIN